jgi:two-component system, chemotaxis family, chemotaxis protein CheY
MSLACHAGALPRGGRIMRFLIVDDDYYCCELLKAVFSHYGTSDVAFDGSEAITCFRRALDEDRPYDVIFLDVVMPGLSGLETLDCLRQIERDYNIHGPKLVKVIIITGYEDPKLSLHNFQKDCESYLAKPFTPRQIMDMVQNMSEEFQALAAKK